MNIDELSFEHQAYEIDDLWKPEHTRSHDAYRIKTLYEHIPPTVRSIVDVGCGGGIFVNFLMSSGNNYERLCGVDRSASALKYVKTEKQQANIDDLPFDDNEFDLVACLEVLEHLPIKTFDLALAEICRVAKSYVLVSVPHNQSLERSLVSCPECHTRFNPDYHMRSFRRESMENLLSAQGFKCDEVFYIQPIYPSINWIISRMGIGGVTKKLPWYAICPMCGYKDATSDDSLVTEGRNQSQWVNMMKSSVKKIMPQGVGYYWIAALYSKD